MIPSDLYVDLFKTFVEHLVHKAELLGTFRREELVALQRLLDLLERLAGVLDVDLVQPLADVQDFLGMDHDISGLSLESA